MKELIENAVRAASDFSVLASKLQQAFAAAEARAKELEIVAERVAGLEERERRAKDAVALWETKLVAVKSDYNALKAKFA